MQPHWNAACAALCALTLMSLSPTPVRADERSTETEVSPLAPNSNSHESPPALAPVIVSASRADTRLEDMPLSTTVISRDQIERSPARTIDQLLREIPGINLSGAPYTSTDPTGHQAKMRGGSNNKVLVLLDGIPIHDPFYGTIQWFKVPLASVERIEVIRGGQSSLWGNLAVTGVINIISRRPVGTGGEVDMSLGTLNTQQLAITKNLSASDSFGLRVSGNVSHTDGYQTTPSTYLTNLPGKGASGAKTGNLQVAATFTPAAWLDGFARVGYHEMNQDIGGYTYGKNLQESPDFAAGLNFKISEIDSAQVNGYRQLVQFDKFNGAGCYLQINNTCNTTAPSPNIVQYFNSHDWNTYRETGGSAVYSRRGQGLIENSQVGIDYRQVSGEDISTTYSAPTSADSGSSSIARTNYGQGTQTTTGVFTQWRLVPTERLSASLSLRYDDWTNGNGVATQNKYSGGVAGQTTGGGVAQTSKSSVSPGLGLRYDLADDLALRAAAYHAFRTPGLNNLYRSFSSTTSITIANPGLQPETLTGYEVGADWKRANMTVGLTAFTYQVNNLIATYKVTGVPPPAVAAICGPTLTQCPATVNYYTNNQDARTNGLELISRWDVSQTLALDAAYVYTDAHYTSSTTGDPIGNQLGAVPEHLVTAGATWHSAERWRLYGQVRYTGSMYLDVNHTIPQNAFTVFNVSANYTAARGLDFYGAAVNLFNTHYVDSATTSAASSTLGMPRAVTVGFRYAFQ